MAKSDSRVLDTNDQFPELDLQLISGETLSLPADTGEGYSVIFFYRGYWWPFCSQQLADFQSLLNDYNSEQVKIIAGSIDPLDKTKEYVEKLGVSFPVAYGMDAEAVSKVTGAYYEEKRKIKCGYEEKRLEFGDYSGRSS